MAHFILEYSDNIENRNLNLNKLFETLHLEAVQSGIFPLKGIRSRAYKCYEYRIADGNPDHQFIHMTVLIGAGRSDAEKSAVAKQFFLILEKHFEVCTETRGLALSFEMKELDSLLKFNKNNISNYL